MAKEKELTDAGTPTADGSASGGHASILAYDIGVSTREGLLDRADFYIDEALALKSRLPLTFLVKGDILVLRGQHQASYQFY